MNDLKEILKGSELLKESPIRKIINKTNRLTIFEEEKIILQEIDKIIDISKGNLAEKLKIVVLGEVKAGKSTLVNALVGKKVSYTNVVEATANILEVKYSEKEKVTIEYNDGSLNKELKSLDELDNIVKQNANNQEFFKNIKKIVLETKTERLKEISLVDTPGLNTITLENAERTNEYIANADVVLWVFSAHHLGQADIEEKIEEVLGYGKPIIAVINRIDEVHEEKEVLIEYLEESLGYLFTNIFATSGKLAWDGERENNKEKIKESNIMELYNYITENIERAADSVQEDSVKTAIGTQIKRDILLHKNSYNRIDKMIEKTDKDIFDIQKFNTDIKSNIHEKLDLWLENEFLEKERRILMGENEEEFKNSYAKYSSGEYLNSLVNEEIQKVNKYLFDEWKNSVESILNKQSDFIINVSEGLDRSEVVIDGVNGNTELMEGAKKGTVAGTAAALGMAGYAAWLGPAATYISLGSAAAAFVPPLLIAGLIGGVAYRLVGSDKNKQKKIAIIENMINDIKREMRINGMKEIKFKMDSISDEYMENGINTILSIFEQCNIKYDNLKEVRDEIKIYIGKVSIYGCDFK